MLGHSGDFLSCHESHTVLPWEGRGPVSVLGREHWEQRWAPFAPKGRVRAVSALRAHTQLHGGQELEPVLFEKTDSRVALTEAA